ncbi:helix-turn-helix domain-containing protein [Peribacillus huizhouensis]|uniref:Group I intron endonuclease n=1 Tax=Peribacillus huizhouensis TaxID=1501239 RepID=A0ABR6CRD6_9BACI|nr:helix-turn-helix domain-containing protein [Peribacillus huizhouensis]MBA9027593.1 group I intron endonuclease [Peribacillus huizhouensis]
MIIYKATNTVNRKVYIGLTIRTLQTRKKRHLLDARSGSEFIFHRAIRRYGEESFKWKVIDKADTLDELNEKEMYWINHYDSYNNGYNMTFGGSALMLGRSHTEEARKKIAEAGIGRLVTEETRRKIREANQGENSSSSKLTASQVLEIHELLKEGLFCSQIAETFGISPIAVYEIGTGRKWKYLFEENFIEARIQQREERGKQIKNLLAEGKLKQKEIAEIFNVGITTVSAISRGRNFSHIPTDTPISTSYRKLKDKDATEIKKLLVQGNLTHEQIAKNFNVASSTITNISLGTTWKHIEVAGFNAGKQDNKLSEESIQIIKELLKEGEMTLQKIADQFNVTKQAIHRIKTGKIYSHVKTQYDDEINKTKERAKLTEQDVREVKLLLKQGNMTNAEIGEKYGVHRRTISDIRLGKTWKHV